MSAAPSMTYDSLIEDIKMYAERRDDAFVNQIPRFIMMAENDIATNVRGSGMQRVVTSKMEQGNPYLRKPNRWRETVSMNITFGTRRRVLHLRTYEFCRSIAPDVSHEEAPRYYSDADLDNWFIAPNPNRNYEFEVLFYERPEPLSETNQTSWLTRQAPNLILFGALLQAQVFLKRDERFQIFQAQYAAAVQGVQQEAQRRVFDRSASVKEG